MSDGSFAATKGREIGEGDCFALDNGTPPNRGTSQNETLKSDWIFTAGLRGLLSGAGASRHLLPATTPHHNVSLAQPTTTASVILLV